MTLRPVRLVPCLSLLIFIGCGVATSDSTDTGSVQQSLQYCYSDCTGVPGAPAIECTAGTCSATNSYLMCDGVRRDCVSRCPPGTACSDGNACTTGDTCNSSGVCVGTPIVCNNPPLNHCTDPNGSCVNGQCRYQSLCGTDQVCSGNQCISRCLIDPRFPC